VSTLVPALVAAAHLPFHAEASRDEALIRTAGLGYAGHLHALDAWLAAGFAAVPIGTRSLRAALPGVLLAGLFAGLLYVTTRRVLAFISTRSVWNEVVAAAATATVTLSYPVQHEAVSVGGSLVGASLVLLALVVAEGDAVDVRAPALAGLSTLGLTYEPLVGMCVLAVVLASVWTRPRAADTARLPYVAIGGAGLLGLVPAGLAGVRAHVSPLAATAHRVFALGSGETGLRHTAMALRGELGDVLTLLAAVGLGWGLWSPRGRRVLAPLVAVAVLAGGMVALGGSPTDDRWSAPALVALAGVMVFAAVAMQEGVLRVARARVPLASASAALVVVIEVTFPTVALDDALQREAARSSRAVSVWEDSALAVLPSGALVLISSPPLYTRLLASKAAGDLPGDVGIVPTFDSSNEAAAAALARDPRLVPMFRDLALVGVPQELSLSTLATVRPLVVAADPRWDRALTRHIVASGLLSTFEAEPRGGADRKHALEALVPMRHRLVEALGKKPEASLRSLTVALVLDRALVAAQTGEHEVLLHSIEDIQAVAPKDETAARLAQREASVRGPIDVRDLVHDGLAGGVQ